ncbi:hypothetical protein EV714DRAFT_269353 [Schizophyllum commune]
MSASANDILPADVLLDIFDACRVLDRDIDPAQDALLVRAGPPAVAAVCARWHSISLLSPLLWTDVHLKVIRPKSESSPSNVAALLRGLLGRSAGLSLTVSLELHRDYDSLDPTSQSLDILMRQSDRWAHLRVLGSMPQACTMLLPVKGKLSQLRSVRLKSNPLSTVLDEDWVDTIRLFSECPRLVRFESNGPSLVPPWEQLTRLDMRTMWPIDGFALLHNVRALRLTEVASTHDWPPTPKDEVFLDAPFLRRATLKSFRLRHLRAPALTECHVYDHLGGFESELDDILGHFRIIGSQLTTLSLFLDLEVTGCTGACDILLECPLLRQLHLRLVPHYTQAQNAADYDNLRVLFASLNVDKHSPALLPCLEELQLLMIAVRPIEPLNELADAIASRAHAHQGVVALHSFILDVSDPSGTIQSHESTKRLLEVTEECQVYAELFFRDQGDFVTTSVFEMTQQSVWKRWTSL